MIDAFSCKCRNPKCRKFHNNTDGSGYCPECRRVRRLFGRGRFKKLEGGWVGTIIILVFTILK